MKNVKEKGKKKNQKCKNGKKGAEENRKMQREESMNLRKKERRKKF